MHTLDRKSKFALLSIFSNTLLIIFKVIAGILSGSVSSISEAIHSAMDRLASVIRVKMNKSCWHSISMGRLFYVYRSCAGFL